jgi:dihydroflavonol-4-reductase
MGERTLVTGAMGYLGGGLVRELLAAGDDIVVLAGPHDPAAPAGVQGHPAEVLRGDVTDERSIDDAMRGVSQVYHLAGIASPNARLGHLIWNTNVIGSYHVARSALRHGVRRVVHVSSTAAIGYPPDGVVADEGFDPRQSVADNVYAASKRAAERLMLDFVDRGLEVVVVNPAAVFAPRSGPQRSWQVLLAAARAGTLRFVPPGGTAVCSARDFVAGLTAAMTVGEPGERYILSTSNLTYRRIAELLLDAVGRRHAVRPVPMGVLRALGAGNRAWRDLTGTAHPDDALTPENVELMSREVYYAPDKAVRDLGLPRVSTSELITEFVR